MITGGGGGSSTPAFAFGTAAARPAAAAANANTAYFATDTGEVTFSDGAAWHQIGAIQVSTSGTLQVGSNNFGGLQIGNSGTMLFKETLGSRVSFSGGDLDISSVGHGLQVAEGSNAKQGTATLTAGSVVVANTSVTANSRIFLTPQDGNTVGSLGISARTTGTSFTIKSSNAADTGVVAYQIFEPG